MVDLDNKDSPEKTAANCNLCAEGSACIKKDKKYSKPFQLNNSIFLVPNKLQLRKKDKTAPRNGLPPPSPSPTKPIAPRMTAAVIVKLLEATGTCRTVKYSTDSAMNQAMLAAHCFQHYSSSIL